jgi:hypothetical protein
MSVSADSNAVASGSRWPRRIIAFVAALAVSVVWASIVQTQYNLAALQSIGATIPAALRWQTTGRDLLGFGPLYAALAGVALVFAFALAALLSRYVAWSRAGIFVLAGWVGPIVAIRVVDMLVPPPVLIAATRTIDGLLLMTVGGAFAGWLFARLTSIRNL